MSRTERRSSAKRVFLALAFVLCLTGAAALGLMAWFQWRPLARAEAAYEAMRQTGRTSGEEMDWAGLQGQYPGIVGWLSAPDAGIDYPVMQGADNSYYLTHLPDGSYNAVGSVYGCGKCPPADRPDDNFIWAPCGRRKNVFPAGEVPQ